MNIANKKIFEQSSLTSLVFLYWVDHEIPLNDPIKIFDTNMLTDLNYKLCSEKEDDNFDQESLTTMPYSS